MMATSWVGFGINSSIDELMVIQQFMELMQTILLLINKINSHISDFYYLLFILPVEESLYILFIKELRLFFHL